MGVWQSFIQKREVAKHAKSAARQARLDQELAEAASRGKWDEAESAINRGAQSGPPSRGHSALFWAAKANSLPMVERLAPGAVWREEANKQSALMAACSGGSLDVFKAVARAMPPGASSEVDEFGASALSFAAAAQSMSIAEELLSEKANGCRLGKNIRWQAASVAAALRHAEMVELLIKGGWESDVDQLEAWEEESSGESLAASAICGESMPARRVSESRLSEHYLMASILGMGRRIQEEKPPELTILTANKGRGCPVSFLDHLLMADVAPGAPPKKESWAVEAFQIAISKFDSASGELIVDRFPSLPTTAFWNGDTPLMAAMDKGMSNLCDKLAPLSDLAATGSDGRSALRRSISSRGKHSFINTAAFAALAKIAPQELWDREEPEIWRDILCDKQSHWSEEDIQGAAMAAASRGSKASLSMALAIAVAEGREQIAEYLFPFTNSQENEAAFAREFIRRCSTTSEGMSALVAQRTAVLREAEAIAESARERPALARSPAKRL